MKREELEKIAVQFAGSATVQSLIHYIYKLESSLKESEKICRTHAEVARAAWGGEIPSPLPGHTSYTEEEMSAITEHLNCPWCGGSGHIDDCDETDKKVKAQVQALVAVKNIVKNVQV